jgi:hypothetical protein
MCLHFEIMSSNQVMGPRQSPCTYFLPFHSFHCRYVDFSCACALCLYLSSVMFIKASARPSRPTFLVGNGGQRKGRRIFQICVKKMSVQLVDTELMSRLKKTDKKLLCSNTRTILFCQGIKYPRKAFVNRLRSRKKKFQRLPQEFFNDSEFFKLIG